MVKTIPNPVQQLPQPLPKPHQIHDYHAEKTIDSNDTPVQAMPQPMADSKVTEILDAYEQKKLDKQQTLSRILELVSNDDTNLTLEREALSRKYPELFNEVESTVKQLLESDPDLQLLQSNPNLSEQELFQKVQEKLGLIEDNNNEDNAVTLTLTRTPTKNPNLSPTLSASKKNPTPTLSASKKNPTPTLTTHHNSTSLSLTPGKTNTISLSPSTKPRTLTFSYTVSPTKTITKTVTVSPSKKWTSVTMSLTPTLSQSISKKPIPVTVTLSSSKKQSHSVTPSPTLTASKKPITVSLTPSNSKKPTPTLSNSKIPSKTLSPTPTLSSSKKFVTLTLTPSKANTVTISVSPSTKPRTLTLTLSPTVKQTITLSPSKTWTSLTLSLSPSLTPSKKPITLTATLSKTPTKSPSLSKSSSRSPSPTLSETGTLTLSMSPSPTGSPSVSPSTSPTLTITRTPTKTPTLSKSHTMSSSLSRTPTVSETLTLSSTKTPTVSETLSSSLTPSLTPSPKPAVNYLTPEIIGAGCAVLAVAALMFAACIKHKEIKKLCGSKAKDDVKQPLLRDSHGGDGCYGSINNGSSDSSFLEEARVASKGKNTNDTNDEIEQKIDEEGIRKDLKLGQKSKESNRESYLNGKDFTRLSSQDEIIIPVDDKVTSLPPSSPSHKPSMAEQSFVEENLETPPKDSIAPNNVISSQDELNNGIQALPNSTQPQQPFPTNLLPPASSESNIINSFPGVNTTINTSKPSQASLLANFSFRDEKPNVIIDSERSKDSDLSSSNSTSSVSLSTSVQV